MKFGPTSCAHPNNTLASRYASIYLRCRSIFRLIDCCITRLHEKRCLGNKETRQTTRCGISSAFDDVVSTRDRPNAEGFTRHANQRSSIVCRFLFFHFLRCKQVVKSVSYQRVHISRERKAHEGKRIDREMRKGRFETFTEQLKTEGWCRTGVINIKVIWTEIHWNLKTRTLFTLEGNGRYSFVGEQSVIWRIERLISTFEGIWNHPVDIFEDTELRRIEARRGYSDNPLDIRKVYASRRLRSIYRLSRKCRRDVYLLYPFIFLSFYAKRY